MTEPRIASRYDFVQTLNAARREVHRLSHAEPQNPAWRFVARQLEVIVQRATGGQEPTLEQRRAFKLGAFVDRELSPPRTEAQAELNGMLRALNLYYVVWPDDGVDPEEMPEDEFLDRI